MWAALVQKDNGAFYGSSCTYMEIRLRLLYFLEAAPFGGTCTMTDLVRSANDGEKLEIFGLY